MLSWISSLFWNVASAHEVYVLPKDEVAVDLHDTSINVFTALQNPENLKTFIIIALGILVALALNFCFQRTQLAKKIGKKLEYFHIIGPLVTRLAVAVTFFYSAYSWSFLGPELSLDLFPYAAAIRIILFILSAFILLGLFTEIAALISFIIFSTAVAIFHLYMLTYVNYLSELVVLILFGSRALSLDGFLFGKNKRFLNYEKYEMLIIRICYGFGLFYAAIAIKLLHAKLTLDVVTQYDLTRFHLLFPHDPMLVVLGAALAEIAIGLFIMFGFQLRLIVLISLFYITLSLLFFRELVWPHYILYGISLNLLFAPQDYTLDKYFDRKLSKTQT